MCLNIVVSALGVPQTRLKNSANGYDQYPFGEILKVFHEFVRLSSRDAIRSASNIKLPLILSIYKTENVLIQHFL